MSRFPAVLAIETCEKYVPYTWGVDMERREVKHLHLFMAFGTALAAVGCGAANQTHATARAAVTGASCAGLTDVERQVADLYSAGNLDRVEPVFRDEWKARAIQLRYVAGAKLYVTAPAGVSEAYLDRVLSCHASAGSSVHPNDPLQGAALKTISVSALGQRFVIRVEGVDRAAGQTIWQHAEALRDQSTRVEVRQLSESTGRSSRF